MLTADNKIHANTEAEFSEGIEERFGPKHIEVMIPHVHCFNCFPVVEYVAATVFQISPLEIRKMMTNSVRV